MLRLLKTAAFLCASGFALGCSIEKSKNDNKNPAFNDQEYIILDGANLQATNDSLSGQGSIVFNAPLGELSSARNFMIRFALTDNGVVEVRSYADNNLQNGISTIFQRKGSSLKLSINSSGQLTEAHTLSGIDAAGEMMIAFDIHNSENPAHIIVWNGSEAAPTAANALYNSTEAHDHDDDHEHGEDHEGEDHEGEDHEDDHHHEEIKGRGNGTFWGFVLDHATIFGASARGAFSEH